MNQRSVVDITVLGGGTAGWLAALYIKTVMPTKTITVIESKDIGIIAAGEGTTSQFVSMLDLLEIPVSTFLKEAEATFKTSIKFTNWNNEGKSDNYFHTFKGYGNVSPEHYQQNSAYIQSAPSIYAVGCSLEDDSRNYNLSAKLAKDNKVSFMYDSRKADLNDVDPIYKFEQISSFALHFDAVKVASTFKKIAIDRGIKVIEGEVKDFTQNENKDVKVLILKDGKEIKTDFVFDCSGFSRFFPKKFKSKWISYKDKLTVNSAIPFLLPMEEDFIPSYTEAIAMKYGWIWKIPLQERYGCGYVFNSDLINAKEAQEEVEEYLGFKIEVPRVITFEPGYYSTPWVNNVISVGLASGFVEPLEATSIWTTITTLGYILTKPEQLYKIDKRVVDNFNKDFCALNESILSFVYFHYMSKRDDTDFWKHYTKENAPDCVKNIINISEYELINPSHLEHQSWPIESWYQVAIGIRQLNLVKNSKQNIFYNFTSSASKSNFVTLKKTQDEVVSRWCVDHKKFISYMKGNPETW